MTFKAINGFILMVLLTGMFGCSVMGGAESGNISKDEYQVRRDRILDYFNKRQNRYEVVATTKTKSGQIIDWIKPESQVPGGKLARSPGEDTMKIRKEKTTLDNPYLNAELPK